MLELLPLTLTNQDYNNAGGGEHRGKDRIPTG